MLQYIKTTVLYAVIERQLGQTFLLRLANDENTFTGQYLLPSKDRGLAKGHDPLTHG